MHLTYPVEDIDAERRKDWEKEQAKERARQAAKLGSKVRVRPDWSDDEHGLAAFFAQVGLAAGQQVRAVDPHRPDLIHLLDEPAS